MNKTWADFTADPLTDSWLKPISETGRVRLVAKRVGKLVTSSGRTADSTKTCIPFFVNFVPELCLVYRLLKDFKTNTL